MNSDPIGAVLFTIFAVLVLAAVTVLQTRHSGPEERDDRGAERASSWNKIWERTRPWGAGRQSSVLIRWKSWKRTAWVPRHLQPIEDVSSA